MSRLLRGVRAQAARPGLHPALLPSCKVKVVVQFFSTAYRFGLGLSEVESRVRKTSRPRDTDYPGKPETVLETPTSNRTCNDPASCGESGSNYEHTNPNTKYMLSPFSYVPQKVSAASTDCGLRRTVTSPPGSLSLPT